MGKDTVVDWRLGSQAVFDKVVPLGEGHGELMCRRPGTAPLSDWSRSTAPHGQRTGVVQAQSPAARFARLSNTDKLGVALRSTARAVGPEMGGKLQELISPTNLAIVAGALAIWVGAHATPIGWVVDIGMVGLGAVALGVEAVNVMRELQAFAMGVIKAQSEADLAEAGLHLAKAIAIVGVDLVVALLLKKAIVKVRQPATTGGEAADGTNLFGKYDPKDAARSLPAEAPLATVKSSDAAAVANSAGDMSQAAIRARVKANLAESAAAREASKFEQLGRYETAYKFYTDAGYSADRALGHLGGIDFTKPVTLINLTPGSNYLQYPLNGKIGNYFTTVGTPAEMIGINPAGRVPTLFTPTTPVKALQSTAADILDTWTLPNQPYMTKGGGLQYFVPNKGAFAEVPTP